MSRSADLNIVNYNHWCPIHIAVRNGQHDAIKAIIKHNKRIARMRLSTRAKQSSADKKQKPVEFDLDAEGGNK